MMARRFDPGHEITVWERNAPDETFGFGVVLSDQTLGDIERADARVLSELRPMLARWDDIDVRFRGTVFRAGGNGFAALSRAGLLKVLRGRCARLGVAVRFGDEITDVDALAADHDVVVAADGANSLVRARYAGTFRPRVRDGRCRYIWLGTDLVLDAFRFYIVDTPGGAVQVHAYPDSPRSSTLIVELSEDAWRAAGFADAAPSRLAPGQSDERSIGMIAELCKELLDGHRLAGNNSRWLRFPTVRCESWRHRNVVLIGDAAHTAHFSIGSGTKLAMDDALCLAQKLRDQPDAEAALAAYDAERRPVVAAAQRAADSSRAWFEDIDRYTHQDPQQFAVNILTRSRRVSYAGLRRRDPGFVAQAERWFAADSAADRAANSAGEGADGRAGPPGLQPYTLGGLALANRVVIWADVPGRAPEGVPGDLHLVSVGGAALGGAGLVLTAAASGGAGLRTERQADGWRRVVGFVHAHSAAKIGVRLGHHGTGGSAGSPDELRREYAAAARRAAAAGFDLLELDCACDGLCPPPPSQAPSPSGGCRDGGTSSGLLDRLRRPLGVLDAIREVWPGERPVSVHLSPAQWFPDGAVAEAANAFAAHGAAGVHVSGGTPDGRDAHADRIRNQAGRAGGFAVIAAGSISEADVDTIVLAGRADLCVVDRPAEGPPRRPPRGTPDPRPGGE
ncbi:FAD-dependent monooxygenase [Actinomadura graeca]|uniref:FAD-dependent monooxygenase n=2 Tax=Actinomadura graeca TaxID=2750812 RepID=A0ABX8R5T4_9ACTN|nr:FAD-dependent monooxygenase [Actinomadura graeca]